MSTYEIVWRGESGSQDFVNTINAKDVEDCISKLRETVKLRYRLQFAAIVIVSVTKVQNGR